MDTQLMEALAGRLSGGKDDPLMNALLTSMMKPRPEEQEAEPLDPATARLRQSVRRLRRSLAAAEQMLGDIANVFGACELCWGEDPSCARCRGRGHPGNAVPIEADLLRWVQPALSRLGLEVCAVGNVVSSHVTVTNSKKEN